MNKDGQIFWNQSLIPDTNALLERLKAVAVSKPQPEVHVRADQTTRYEYVGRVILDGAARRHPEGRVHHGARARPAVSSSRRLAYD